MGNEVSTEVTTDTKKAKVTKKGKIAWLHGKYQGDLVNGVPHGFGSWTHDTDGSSYSGKWRQGKQHGTGTAKLADGTEYEGMWENCKAHGYGTGFLADGSVFHRGLWANSKPVKQEDIQQQRVAPTEQAQTPLAVLPNKQLQTVQKPAKPPDTALAQADRQDWNKENSTYIHTSQKNSTYIHTSLGRIDSRLLDTRKDTLNASLLVALEKLDQERESKDKIKHELQKVQQELHEARQQLAKKRTPRSVRQAASASLANSSATLEEGSDPETDNSRLLDMSCTSLSGKKSADELNSSCTSLPGKKSADELNSSMPPLCVSTPVQPGQTDVISPYSLL
eukprot:g29834.t1